ncbi:hypothetical protein ACGFI9_04810 [Micromonospora sp. NPDC048930]|uniref:hypothetical protein n=1 Tax=Micromonospora sp. NPDC048930 TaxID=3364261 RepID=UPI00371D18B9
MSKQRYLVLHDYGMGGLWWWIHARSTREVLETFAEVEVVDDPAAVARTEGWELDEVDIDASTLPAGLDELRAKRDRQRTLPGFGALADRQVVFLRQAWNGDDPATYLMEVGPDGRRIRQVEVADDGTAIKTDAEDWPFNPPVVDLFDPQLPDQEIDRDEFERAWAAARWEDGR